MTSSSSVIMLVLLLPSACLLLASSSVSAFLLPARPSSSSKPAGAVAPASFSAPPPTSIGRRIRIRRRRRSSIDVVPPLAMGGASSGGGEVEIIECDVAIIGGGPAGCTCALYASRADLSTVIIDKNPGSGALAITSHIANYPGVDRSMSGQELLDQMRAQAVSYGARYERAQVFMIDVTEGETGDPRYTKTVYTPDVTVRARSLVLATGAMGRVGRPFPGEAEFLGRGVSYCATCDGAFYRDSPVAVYGASTEAIEEALFLTKFASKVYWITSVDISRETESGLERNKVLDQGLLEQLLECDNVHHMEKTRLLEVVGDVSGVTGVRVRHPQDESETTLEVEGAFVYGAGGGSKPITDFVQSKVNLDEHGGVIVDADMKTSVDGVYAIGDIRNTDYKQVVVAASDGCIAAMSIEKFLNNRKMVKVDWIHR